MPSIRAAIVRGDLSAYLATPDIALDTNAAPPGQAVWAIDESAGGDGVIVSAEISSLADLKGKFRAVGDARKSIIAHYEFGGHVSNRSPSDVFNDTIRRVRREDNEYEEALDMIACVQTYAVLREAISNIRPIANQHSRSPIKVKVDYELLVRPGEMVVRLIQSESCDEGGREMLPFVRSRGIDLANSLFGDSGAGFGMLTIEGPYRKALVTGNVIQLTTTATFATTGG